MTKLHAFLLLLLALIVAKGAQFFLRRQVHGGKLAIRNLSILDLVLIVCIVGLGIFLATTGFSDWLTPKPVQIGIILTGTTVGIFCACPGRQAIRPYLAFLTWFALDTLRPWILDRQLVADHMWTGTLSALLILIEICLGAFISYRLLRGVLTRNLRSVHGGWPGR
jgi:hypothetical protein